MKERFSDQEPKPAFTVDPHGAYLTKLLDADGRPILFSRTEIEGKTRGGCHVCLPNFGPDASGTLAQHGFGRTVDWDVVGDGPDIKELVMPQIEGEYAGLRAALRYMYSSEGGSRLTMNLAVHNAGLEALRIAPAFHPYLAVPHGEKVYLNDEELDISQYADTEFIDGTTHVLRIGDRRLTLHSDQLTKWALWTDGRGDYFCVEPTLEGPSFASPDGQYAQTLLGPDELQSYEFRIDW